VAATIGDSIFVHGGSNSHEVLTSVERFDLRAGKWEAAPPAPSRRYGHAAAALGDHLYVFGGRDNSPQSPFNSTERFDSRAGKWETFTPMRTRRGYLTAAAAAPDLLYVIGGNTQFDNAPTGTLGEGEVFSVSAGRWDPLPPLITRRERAAAVRIVH
jgi:serine/threonine-protein kinase PknK